MNNKIDKNKTLSALKIFLNNNIGLFRDYFEFDFNLYNEAKQYRIIKGEFNDYYKNNSKILENDELFNGLKEKFNEFKAKYNKAKNDKKPQLNFEILFLQPLFNKVYRDYIREDGIKKNPCFYVFFRGAKLDLEDKKNKILFEIKRNHKSANYAWFNAIGGLIEIRASADYNNDYLSVIFMIDIESKSLLSNKEREFLNKNEIYFYRLYKKNNRKILIDTNLSNGDKLNN